MLEKFTSHLENWKKVWFGLIFLGSVFNAISKEFSFLSVIPNITMWSFALGIFIGLIAKYRGKWLWG